MDQNGGIHTEKKKKEKKTTDPEQATLSLQARWDIETDFEGNVINGKKI